MSRTERRVDRLWYGSSWPAALLVPFSWLYRAAVALRRGFYRAGLLRSVRFPVPVIVVGNVTVGGSGKTPLVVWLVRYLAENGMRPGIVSRGYGGRVTNEPVIVGAEHSAEDVGDEPLLLARRTGVPICICADRVSAVRHLLSEADVSIIVADDGLQHYRLQRDLEIVVIDGQRGLGNGWMLPAGPLREAAGRLSEVDLVLSNGAGGSSFGDVFELQPETARALSGPGERNLREFRGMRVWAVAGIGNPARFFGLLESFGIVVDPVMVADHGRVDLDRLAHDRDQPILMTEKDGVKYPDTSAVDAWCVPVEVRMSDGAVAALAARIGELEAGAA